MWGGSCGTGFGAKVSLVRAVSRRCTCYRVLFAVVVDVVSSGATLFV